MRSARRSLRTAAALVLGVLALLASAAPAWAAEAAKAAKAAKPLWHDLLPIAGLIAVIVFVVARLPKVDLGHSQAFRRRRAFNWVPLGMTYAFLYMGRYNISVYKDVGGLTLEEFGTVFGVGSLVYGVSFLLNGPLTDRWGGRRTILISAAGSAVCNLAMGALIVSGHKSPSWFAVLYGANMYFQSFGAVSIVKVNAGWFHVRERGTLGGVFGILISLGLYFAYDWGFRIAKAFEIEWLFVIPAIVLAVFFVIAFVFVRDNPSDAGFPDFDTGDASSGEGAERVPAMQVFKRMMTNKVIIIISLIELCSGFLRQAILQWYRDFSKGVGTSDSFVYENWGMVSCVAGITGGIFAGVISDHLFGARRAPVSAVLYGIMLLGAILILPLFGMPYAISWVIASMSMAIIGVHGMLSGTASGDFGGKKNAGIATGIIDGFVYLGSTVQSFLYGAMLPAKGSEAAKDIENWYAWPIAMIPVAAIGLALATRVWHARPQPKSAPAKA